MNGQVFGCLTVVEEVPASALCLAVRWRCVCSRCGESSVMYRSQLADKRNKWTRCPKCGPVAKERPETWRRKRSDKPERRRSPSFSLVRPHGYEPPRAKRKLCPDCCGLPWQRPPDGCVRCGGAYGEERIEIELLRESPIAAAGRLA